MQRIFMRSLASQLAPQPQDVHSQFFWRTPDRDLLVHQPALRVLVGPRLQRNSRPTVAAHSLGSKFPLNATGLVKRTASAAGGKLPALPGGVQLGKTLGLLEAHVTLEFARVLAAKRIQPSRCCLKHSFQQLM